VLAELDAAAYELAAEHGGVRGELVIGAFPSAAAQLVVPAVRALHERHPELVCSVLEHEPEDGIPLLRAGELDLLVSESYAGVSSEPAGGLERHVLLSEPLLLVLPEGRDAPAGLGALAEEPWIAGVPDTPFVAALERACRDAGFAPRIAHRADDATLFQALAAAGLGVGLLPALACTPAPGVRYARVRPEPPRREIAALLRRGSAARPALAAALAALRGPRPSPGARSSLRPWR
jgi:DNA-binding transcriptional LysR family regulator